MNHWRVFLFVLSALLAAFVAVVIYIAPVLAAVACPSCYGFERLTPRLYVEQHTPAAKQQQLQEMLRDAEKQVLQNLGMQILQPPYFLACHSTECDQRLGGKGARAVAYGSEIIRLSPRGWDPVILAHELAHIVLHEQITLRHWAQNRIPAWMDEGIAVIVSRDPRYLEISETGQLSCKTAPEAPLPEEPRDWRRQAGAGQSDIYAMAACRVLQEAGSEPRKLRALFQSSLEASLRIEVRKSPCILFSRQESFRSRHRICCVLPEVVVGKQLDERAKDVFVAEAKDVLKEIRPRM